MVRFDDVCVGTPSSARVRPGPSVLDQLAARLTTFLGTAGPKFDRQWNAKFWPFFKPGDPVDP